MEISERYLKRLYNHVFQADSTSLQIFDSVSNWNLFLEGRLSSMKILVVSASLSNITIESVHEGFVEAFYQSYRNKAPSVKTVQRAVHHELQVPGHTYVEPEVGSHQTEQFDMMHIDGDRIIDLDGMIQNAEQFNATWLAP